MRRRKGTAALVLLLLLVAGLLALAVRDASPHPSWVVPRWLPGDQFHVAVSDDNARDEIPFTISLGQPFPLLDAYGRWMDAVEYAPAFSGRLFLDLERGISVGHLDQFGGIDGNFALVMTPGFWISEPAVGIQGMTLKPGISWTTPDVWSGNWSRFSVVDIDQDRALVRVEEGPKARPPFLPGRPENDVITHDVHYRRGEAYPHLVLKYRAGADGFIGEQRLVSMQLASGDRTTPRAYEAAHVPPRDEVVRSSWPETLVAGPLLDIPLDIDDTFAMAANDAGLRSFTAKHPNATLAEIRFVTADHRHEPERAYGWNLTFVNPADSSAYSFVRGLFVRAPTIAPLGEEPCEAGPLPPGYVTQECTWTDFFFYWKTAAHVLPFDLTGLGALEPQITPEEALRLYREHSEDAPPAKALAWSRFGHRDGRSGMVSSAPTHVSPLSAWAFGWGNITYLDGCRDSNTEDPSCSVAENFRHSALSATTGEILGVNFPPGSMRPYVFP